MSALLIKPPFCAACVVEADQLENEHLSPVHGTDEGVYEDSNRSSTWTDYSESWSDSDSTDDDDDHAANTDMEVRYIVLCFQVRLSLYRHLRSIVTHLSIVERST